MNAYREWQRASADEEAARELATEDASFAAEAEQFAGRRAGLEQRLRELLVPRDASDGKDVILEVKAGEGGEESALFAGDLLRMYLRYAERRGWKTEILDATMTGLGGYKDATVAVKAPRGADGVWASLKYEGGVHRVQRVPVTESQGRIHTSSATVTVLPEADDIEIDIPNTDLEFQTFRATGPGGQSVNTTDSAVRVTHKPTGLVVSMQDEKSQLQNKAKALQVLRARLLQLEQERVAAEQSAERKGQTGGGGRSEKIRTYNFKENRITDHRIGFTAYNLDKVLGGEVDDVVAALLQDERQRQLAEG